MLLDKQIKERVSLWTKLANSNKPIVIYGMGDGAEKIINAANTYGIKIAEVFASDEFVRGHYFKDFKVKKLSEIEEQYDDFIILLAFAANSQAMIDTIFQLSKKYTLYAPDLPVTGSEAFTFEYYLENKDNFQKAYELMADDDSKKVFSNIINFKISGDINYLAEHSIPENDLMELVNLTDKEHYLDLGAYDGDTIRQLIEIFKGYSSIVALEPDKKNFKKLTKFVDKESLSNITIINKASYSENTLLPFSSEGSRNSAMKTSASSDIEAIACDSIEECKNTTYIKMDVEGAEYETILGCKGLIATNKPKLNVSVYHKNDDLFKIPLLINELNPSYKFYLRKHRYLPAWEIILYCI